MSKKPKSIKQIIADHVVVTDSCWLWSGVINHNGYGSVYFHGSRKQAHRVIFEFFKEPIEKGLQLDHICKIRRCVNPDHLEPVTPAENNARSESITAKFARAVTCIHGHPFSGKNLMLLPNGHRVCKECRRTHEKKNREEKKRAATS